MWTGQECVGPGILKIEREGEVTKEETITIDQYTNDWCPKGKKEV